MEPRTGNCSTAAHIWSGDCIYLLRGAISTVSGCSSTKMPTGSYLQENPSSYQMTILRPSSRRSANHHSRTAAPARLSGSARVADGTCGGSDACTARGGVVGTRASGEGVPVGAGRSLALRSTSLASSPPAHEINMAGRTNAINRADHRGGEGVPEPVAPPTISPHCMTSKDVVVTISQAARSVKCVRPAQERFAEVVTPVQGTSVFRSMAVTIPAASTLLLARTGRLGRPDEAPQVWM